MAIDDRLRDGLRRSASRMRTGEGAPEHLWGGIERGARRRQATTRLAAAGVSLAVVAASVALVAIAFGGPRHLTATEQHGLSVRHVKVLPASGSIAKIEGDVANNGPRPVGAEIRCTVFDRSGTKLGDAAGAVPWVGAGESTRFVVGGRYRTAPATARCISTAVPAVNPSPSPGVAGFKPLSVAFWDANHGIMTGVSGEPECSPTCVWDIQRTEDGGRTWGEVERSTAEIFDVAIVPPPAQTGCGFGCGVPVGRSSWAWALEGPCAMGTCTVDVLYSGDAGTTWAKRATTDLTDLTFASASDGWGISKVFANGQRLESTADGGRTWRSHPVPCPATALTATDVSFVSPQRGWLLCTSQGGAGNANRVILETTDGGSSWHITAEAVLGAASSGGLTAAGYPTGINFLADGHGWMWSARGAGLWSTTDGGRSWVEVGREVVNGASTTIGSVWFLSDSAGFALLNNGDAQATQLIETGDGGQTWHVIHSWSY